MIPIIGLIYTDSYRFVDNDVVNVYDYLQTCSEDLLKEKSNANVQKTKRLIIIDWLSIEASQYCQKLYQYPKSMIQ